MKSPQRKINAAKPGTIACREYEYRLPDGTEAGFAVTLRNFTENSAAANFARENGAIAHGLISILGVSDAPSHPIVWMHTRDELVIIVAENDSTVSEDLKRVLLRVLRAFFRDIRDIAPGLAGLQQRIRPNR